MKIRQLISKVLVICIVLVSVSVPTMAAEMDISNDNMINVLEYSSESDRGTNYKAITSADNRMTYVLGMSTVPYYVDIVFSRNGAEVTNLALIKGAQSRNLTIVPLGNMLYRAYGTVSRNASDTMILQFTVSGTAWVEILSFKASIVEFDSFPNSTGMSFGTKAVAMSGPGMSARLNFTYSSTAVPHFYAYGVDVDLADWELYDYVDLDLTLCVNSIASLEVDAGGIALPFDCSYFALSDGGWIPWDSSGDTSVWTSPTLVHLLVRIDLTGLRRNADIVPVLRVTGTYDISFNTCYIELHNYTGFVEVAPTNVIFTWLSRITSSIKNFALNTHEHLSQMWVTVSNGFSSVIELLDQLVGSGEEGSEVSQGAADMQQQVDQIQDFEHNQQAVLDQAMPELEASVNVSSYDNAFAFLMGYTNRIWLGMADVSVIYTLPMFLGVFFFLCSRVPGITRWSPPRRKESDPA